MESKYQLRTLVNSGLTIPTVPSTGNLQVNDVVKSLRLTVSQKIEVRKQAGQEYSPAEIQELRGEALRVKYDDETEEWTLVRLLRIPSAPESAPERP